MRKFLVLVSAVVVGMAVCAAGAVAQDGGKGRVIVTVLPAGGDEGVPAVAAGNVKIKVNGKSAEVTGWTALRGADARLELVVLIDGSARTSLGTQLDEIAHFVREAPANAKVAIGYMQNGRALMTGPLTNDASASLNGLHLPGGTPGSNGSPYFCLSDLAKNWPSTDTGARREVVMITDGVDEYDQQRMDMDDPYVQTAIGDSVRAGLVVHAMYWTNRGAGDNGGGNTNTAQSLLLEVTDATGGDSYWEGIGNPVSLDPFFVDLRRRLQNQYALTFAAPLKGKAEMENLKVQVEVHGKVSAPRQVWVGPAGTE